MRPFDYARPETIAETIALLEHQSGDGALETRVLAGGTDLLPLMKSDLLAPNRLLDIKRLADLDDRIELEDGALRIGALATLAELEEHPLVRTTAPALADAAAAAASPQLRNMATIGGNLLQRPRCWYFRDSEIDCWLKGGDDCPAAHGENQRHAIFNESTCKAVHPSDPATALVALDAEVQIRGPRGERRVPAEQFFAPPTDDRRIEHTLAGDEVIIAITIPPADSGTGSVYLKAMDRNAWAFALVGVAARVTMDAGRIRDARLVLGGVAPTPHRCHSAETLLAGIDPRIEHARFGEIADEALAAAEPLSHNRFKVPLARALIIRALDAISVGASSR
jgi:xanthine dehydrogenase YagS FAD-binding subunit